MNQQQINRARIERGITARLEQLVDLLQDYGGLFHEAPDGEFRYKVSAKGRDSIRRILRVQDHYSYARGRDRGRTR